MKPQENFLPSDHLDRVAFWRPWLRLQSCWSTTQAKSLRAHKSSRKG